MLTSYPSSWEGVYPFPTLPRGLGPGGCCGIFSNRTPFRQSDRPLQGSYRAVNKSIRSKIAQGSQFCRQNRPRSSKTNRKLRKTKFFVRKFSGKKFSSIFCVKKSIFANRPKRVLPKFGGDRTEVRGVAGRSKFVVAVRPRRDSRSVYNFVTVINNHAGSEKNLQLYACKAVNRAIVKRR